MTYQLIRRQGDFPPENYKYTDPRTGKEFDGNGGFNFTVEAILYHRRGNPKLYPPEDLKFLDFDYVAVELDTHTCARLNNSSQFCKRSDGVVILPKDGGETVPLKSPCPNCGGTEGVEKLCQTCAGRRVTGYSCKQCGFLIGL